MVKRAVKIGLFLFLISFSFLKADVIEVFESPTCPHCRKLKREFFPEICSKYNVSVIYYDLGEPENFKIYAEKLKKLGLPVEIPSALSVVFYKGNVLAGEDEIHEKLPELLEGKEKSISKRLKAVNPAVIIGAGLVDGINPCAFAVIVFFISFLLAAGRRRREVFLTGIFYIPGVFLTYFLLGLSLKEMIGVMRKILWLKYVFLVSAGILCFLFSYFSFYDWKKLKSRDLDITLKLPEKLKKKINHTISKFVMKKYAFVSAFFLGSVVSINESVCTGQVYIPVILLLSDLPMKKGIFYLGIYNFFFILPLILVFILAFAGYGSKVFIKMEQKSLPLSKFILAVVFLILGILLFHYSFIEIRQGR